MSDTKLFRAALLLSGFFERSECLIFNDKRNNFRRLKLWFATPVFNAPQKQQQALEQLLRETFGNRILSMYFVKAERWHGVTWSFCIRLKD